MYRFFKNVKKMIVGEEEMSPRQFLCEDVVGHIFSFCQMSERTKFSFVCRNWNNAYKIKIDWTRMLTEIFPEVRDVPEEYRSLRPDFHRLCYLYVTQSSWRWDEECAGENLELSENKLMVSTQKEDHGSNRSISTSSTYLPKQVIRNNERIVKSEILEIRVRECNEGNFAIGVVNELFEYDVFSFAGFGTPIEDYSKEVTEQTSYGISSNGFIRSNGKEVRVKRIRRKDVVSMIWTRKGNQGHRIEFYRNGKFMGACNEMGEIRTQWLKCTVTLYNAKENDRNELEIRTRNLKVGFWDHVLPKIIDDLGKESLFYSTE